MADRKELLRQAEQILADHAALGIQPIPLLGKDPRINGKGWGNRDYKPADFIRNGAITNIGWLYGPASNGLCEIDIDTDRFADISKVVALYNEIGCVQAGRGGQVRRVIFRVEDRPENMLGNGGVNAKLPYALTNKTNSDGSPTSAGLNWRLGGLKREGDKRLNLEVQSCVIGTHPDTGEELEFMNESEPADIPTIPWESALALWHRMLDSTGAIAQGKGGQSQFRGIRDPADIKPRQPISDFDWSDQSDMGEWLKRVKSCLSASLVCAHYGLPVVAGQPSQPCPFCHEKRTEGEHLLFVSNDDWMMTCFHANTCPAANYGMENNVGTWSFSPLDVIAYKEDALIDDLEWLLHTAEKIMGIESMLSEVSSEPEPATPPAAAAADGKKSKKGKKESKTKDDGRDSFISVGLPSEAQRLWLDQIIDGMRGNRGKLQDGIPINMGYGDFLRIDEQHYLWNGKTWQPASPGDVEARVSLLARGITAYTKKVKDELQLPRKGLSPTDSHMRHIMGAGLLFPPSQTGLLEPDRARGHNFVTCEMMTGWQGFQDGYLRVAATGELEFMEGRRDMVFPRSLPYDAPREIVPTEEIIAVDDFPLARAMHEWWPGDAAMRLRAWEFLGSVVIGNPVQRKLCVAFGAGGTGKTTYADCVGAMAGEQHFAWLEVSNFRDESFIISQVDGTSVVHINDAPAASEMSGVDGNRRDTENDRLLKEVFTRAKSWLGAQSVKGRGPYARYKNCRTEFQMVLTTNELPRVGGASEDNSFRRRLLLLPMMEVIPPASITREDFWRELVGDSAMQTEIARYAVSAYSHMRLRSGGGREVYTTTEALEHRVSDMLTHDDTDLLDYLEPHYPEDGPKQYLPLPALVLLWQFANGQAYDLEAVSPRQQGMLRDMVCSRMKVNAKRMRWNDTGKRLMVLEDVHIDIEEDAMLDVLDDIEDELGYKIFFDPKAARS